MLWKNSLNKEYNMPYRYRYHWAERKQMSLSTQDSICNTSDEKRHGSTEFFLPFIYLFCISSLVRLYFATAVVTSPYEWKNLKWDEKSKTKKHIFCSERAKNITRQMFSPYFSLVCKFFFLKNFDFRTANLSMLYSRDIFYHDILYTVSVCCPSCQKLIPRNSTTVKQFNLNSKCL